MNLILASKDLDPCVKESNVVGFYSPLPQGKVAEIRSHAVRDQEQAKEAFEYVRDRIGRSFDLNSVVVTTSAPQAMTCKERICFTESHLLAALLRGLGIPAGFCYQRVTRKGTPEPGYALHDLNAVYQPSRQVGFRLVPRGNKPGVNSQPNAERKQLAYTICPALGEEDYPCVFADPLEEVLASMSESAECHELFSKSPQLLRARN